MSKFVRASKFRHVFGSPFKKEDCFDNVRVTRNAWDSNFCAANEKFVAVCVEAGGGGACMVFCHSQSGKIDAEFPRIVGHKGAILDIAFNPFNPNMLATASDDTTIKIWLIPDNGLTENMVTPALSLEGHGRKVGQVVWHPTAENILFSTSTDLTIRAWNVQTGKEVKQYLGHLDSIYSMSFNEDGSQFATTCKDKKIRIYDSHTCAIIKEEEGHQGSKASRVVWLGAENKLITTGFSKTSERQYILWDSTTLEALKTENLDTTSGVLMPFYDGDIKVLYLAGKGDGNVRYYEINDEQPLVHFLSEYKSSTPQRGMGFMPKRGCNVSICEVNRFYKLHAQNLVEPISFIVPRKSDVFQDDLFPETQGDQPSLTAEEWLSGMNKGPLKISLRDGFKPTEKAEYVAPVVDKPSGVDNPQTPKEYEEAYHKLTEEVKKLRNELATRDITIRTLEAKLAS